VNSGITMFDDIVETLRVISIIGMSELLFITLIFDVWLIIGFINLSGNTKFDLLDRSVNIDGEEDNDCLLEMEDCMLELPRIDEVWCNSIVLGQVEYEFILAFDFELKSDLVLEFELEFIL